MTTYHHNRIQADHDDEERRVTKVVNMVSLAGLFFLGGIAIKSWFSGHFGHAAALLVFFLLLALTLLIYWRTRNNRAHKTRLLVTVAIMFAYLVASGGESNTGPLWLYVFPPLAFYLTNLRSGTTLLVGCMAFSALVFRVPELPFVFTEYDNNFQLRFFATMLFSSIFCFVLEASRRNARAQLLESAATQARAARTDELTGLSNRRDMQQQLTKEFARYQRAGHHFSVILIDLDYFKRINDDYGHDAGDSVLQNFATIMCSVCRETDIVARWGGEEFLILLPDTSLLDALTLAERLRTAVADHHFLHAGNRLPTTMSAGVCSISQFDDISEILRQADQNLYEAKQSGRNCIAPRVRSKTASRT